MTPGESYCGYVKEAKQENNKQDGYQMISCCRLRGGSGRSVGKFPAWYYL